MTISILHMYYDLMNLYGDYGNVAILSRELQRQGFDVRVERMSVGDTVEFCKYDMLYMGCGTERSQRACMVDLARYREQSADFIHAEGAALFTGNAHELLGNTITAPDGKRYQSLGLFDFETIQDNNRVTGDCIYNCDFLPDKLIGFTNRSGGQAGNIDRPFKVEFDPGATSDGIYEGIMVKNTLGTYLTGPVLIRNPGLLRYYSKLLCRKKDPAHVYLDTVSPNQTAAYHSALEQLTLRMNG